MSSYLPDIESLRCFIEAAETLNFRAAAGRVGLTPAALGQRIRQLEERMEVSLFERTTRRVELTRAGMSLLPRAKEAVLAAGECVRAARGELGPAPMSLTFGTRYELGLSWIQPMLPELKAAFPHVTFHLYLGSGEDLNLKLMGHEIDCAVTSHRIVESQLDTAQLHEEKYVLVASADLPGLSRINGIDSLADHTLVDTNASLPLFRYFREAVGGGAPAQFAGERFMGSIEAIRVELRRGQGVGVLPLYLVKPDLQAGRLVRLLPEVELLSDYFRLMFRRNDARVSFFRALAERMCAHPLR